MIWTLNWALFMAHLLHPEQYQQMVAQGQACYVLVPTYQQGRPKIPGPPPACPYGPENPNWNNPAEPAPIAPRRAPAQK